MFKENGHQSNILYPVKLFFNTEEDILSDSLNEKEFISNRFVLLVT